MLTLIVGLCCLGFINPMQLSKRNFKEKKKLVTGSRWAPDTRIDWPAVGRKLTATATTTKYTHVEAD
jgi:hypothetical protein